MAAPVTYNRQFNFAEYQALNPASSLPGNQVDIEYNAVKITLDQIISNLGLIQRSDNALANQTVGIDQLKPELAGLATIKIWLTQTSYIVGQAVFFGTDIYRCLVAHTSSVFATDLAAGKWVYVVSFTPVTDTNVGIPQGRLTLLTGVSKPAADIATASSHFFTPDIGQRVPLWDGGKFVMTDVGGELTQATTDTTKSPAAVAANKIYDGLVWLDNAIPRCTRSNFWSSDKLRGTGAGTPELELLQGVWVNKFDVVNGPAARRGTLVGSMRSNGASLFVDTAAFRWVSNVYNAIPRKCAIYPATPSWTYTTATYRQMAGVATNQLSFLQSLGGAELSAVVKMYASNTGATSTMGAGLDLDSINTTTLVNNLGGKISLPASTVCEACATWRGFPGQGLSVLIPKEFSDVGGTTTWVGVNTNYQSGVEGEILL